MTEELATFRRRAIQAEGRVRELEHALAAAEERAAGSAASASEASAEAPRPRRVTSQADEADAEPGRIATLQEENARLRQRLDGATERTRQLLDRMRFLRQQQEQETTR